jgi:hypothetical protein
MKRILQVFLSLVVVVSGIALYNLLRDVQSVHSWLRSFLVLLPEFGTIVAVFELEHSAKANELRKERNKLAEANNELQRQLDTERNEHLGEIAKRMQRPQTVAERNAVKLREYIGSPVAVTNGDDTRWPSAAQIAEVSESNIVALFQPMWQGSQASVVYAHCADVEILEVAQGACPIQVKLNKRYGNLIQLGEITKWEDRRTSSAKSVFERGGVAYNAQFRKPGSSETKTLFVYSSKDGVNSFLLEASTGERFIGDNKAVSIRFLSLQVDYLSDGFHRGNVGTGESHYALFVC